MTRLAKENTAMMARVSKNSSDANMITKMHAVIMYFANNLCPERQRWLCDDPLNKDLCMKR